jgi:hypothetical protein
MPASAGYFIQHAAVTSNFVQRSIVAVSLRGPPSA